MSSAGGYLAFDPDALQYARQQMRSVWQDVSDEATRHHNLIGEVEWNVRQAGQDIWNVLTQGLLPDPWQVWERWGFGAITGAARASQGIVEAAQARGRQAVQQVASAHDAALGWVLQEHALPVDPAISEALSFIWRVSTSISVESIVELVQHPGAILDILQAAQSALARAAEAVADYISFLERLLQREEQLLQQIVSDLAAAASYVVAMGGTVFAHETRVYTNLPTDPRPTTMAGLFNDDDAQYGKDAPIGITQAGPNTIVVTLAGLEPGDPGQANNALWAVLAGAGMADNPYSNAVRAAIAQYIREHPELRGHGPVQVIIAGHSFGGIVAQELAQDPSNSLYTITDVVTFGSPRVAGDKPGVHYMMYFNQDDPVPHLSTYEHGFVSGETLVTLNHSTGTGLQGMLNAHGAYGDSPQLNALQLNGPNGLHSQVSEWVNTEYFSTVSP